MRGGRVKKVCREKETESQRGTEAEAGDYRTIKALELCCEFKKRGGRNEEE